MLKVHTDQTCAANNKPCKLNCLLHNMNYTDLRADRKANLNSGPRDATVFKYQTSLEEEINILTQYSHIAVSAT